MKKQAPLSMGPAFSMLSRLGLGLCAANSLRTATQSHKPHFNGDAKPWTLCDPCLLPLNRLSGFLEAVNFVKVEVLVDIGRILIDDPHIGQILFPRGDASKLGASGGQFC